MKVELAVLGSPSLIFFMVSAAVKTATLNDESAELRRCVKVEVGILGPPSLIFLMLCVDVKQH